MFFAFLRPEDRDKIRKLVSRPPRLNARIKAEVLLEAERGVPDEQIANRLRVHVDEVIRVVAAYRSGGLEAVGLTRTPSTQERPRTRSRHPGVVKTLAVCGGSADQWHAHPGLAARRGRKLGASEAQLLNDYRTLKARDLVAAWDYADKHPEEIEQDIRRNAMG